MNAKLCACRNHHEADETQEGALGVVFSHYPSSFYVLLDKDRSISLHGRNSQLIMIKHFKRGLHVAFMRIVSFLLTIRHRGSPDIFASVVHSTKTGVSPSFN